MIEEDKRLSSREIRCHICKADLNALRPGKVGATRQTIGLIEAGRYNPTIKLCIKICIALHKHLDDLFWEDDYDKEEL